MAPTAHPKISRSGSPVPKRWPRRLGAILALSGVLLVASPAGADWNNTPLHLNPFLTCVRGHESGAGGWPYNLGAAYATGNGHYGAYQMAPGISAAAARTAGLPLLAGTTANRWSMEHQDRVVYFYAHWIYRQRGRTPWAPDRCDWLLR